MIEKFLVVAGVLFLAISTNPYHLSHQLFITIPILLTPIISQFSHALIPDFIFHSISTHHFEDFSFQFFPTHSYSRLS